MRSGRHANQTELVEKRKIILAALTSAIEDMSYPDENFNADVPVDGEYYSLTPEEVDALIYGDVEKIKSWVSSLDKRQAAWLLHQLIDGSW